MRADESRSFRRPDLSPGSRRVQRTSGRPQARANAAEGPGDVKARAPLRATALARLGLDIARTRPTLDMAFEGANRDFERFPAYLRRRPRNRSTKHSCFTAVSTPGCSVRSLNGDGSPRHATRYLPGWQVVMQVGQQMADEVQIRQV